MLERMTKMVKSAVADAAAGITEVVGAMTLRRAVEGLLPSLEEAVRKGLGDDLARVNEKQRASLVAWVCAVIQLKLEWYLGEREGDRGAKDRAHKAVVSEMGNIKSACVADDKASADWIPGLLGRSQRLTTTIARDFFTEAQERVIANEKRKGAAEGSRLGGER